MIKLDINLGNLITTIINSIFAFFIRLQTSKIGGSFLMNVRKESPIWLYLDIVGRY